MLRIAIWFLPLVLGLFQVGIIGAKSTNTKVTISIVCLIFCVIGAIANVLALFGL